MPSHRQPLIISPGHTIAERERFTPSCSGRDTIATTSPPIDQKQASIDYKAAARAIGHPARLVPFPVLFHPSGGKGMQSKRTSRRKGREGTRAKDAASIFARSSLLSVALTVHALARSSLPSSSAVPVILRPDLVRSFSSVRPSVFLFLVPRSPSCRLTAKPSPAAHYLTSSHHRQSVKGSPRPVLGDVIATHRHRSTSSKQTAGQRLDGLPS